MKLRQEFYRLPLRFDVERLQQEVRDLPESAWGAHPSNYAGNRHARLISVNGGENDEVGGVMKATTHLKQCPYIAAVLASFGVVWSRSRLMKLAPHAVVPEHSDINYHWFQRVRVHIPIFTRPEVKFRCGERQVHMGPGEAWIFDNWRPHSVVNPTDHERVHLVADTTGSAAFWQMVASSGAPDMPTRELRYRPDRVYPDLLLERCQPPAVMHPAEVEILLGDLVVDLMPADESPAQILALGRVRYMLDAFCKDWRQLWMLHGEGPAGWPSFVGLRDALRDQLAVAGGMPIVRTNGVPAARVVEARVLRHVLASSAPIETQQAPPPRRGLGSNALPERADRAEMQRFDRPVIIVAAPRSGSTLLFETLSCTPQLVSVGGEAPWMIEGHAALRPGAPQVDSNRLTGDLHTEEIGRAVRAELAGRLVDWQGRTVDSGNRIRFLEKTPRNALRIPFLAKVFPDARFVFLWREARDNISSIINAWQSGRWITYPKLEGWEGPWSLLLPPGWQTLRGRPVEEVAAYQWAETNQTVIRDMAMLPAGQGCCLSYRDLVANPEQAIRRICEFADLEFDEPLALRCGGPLPLSRYTQAPPEPEKWMAHADILQRVLPGTEVIERQLRAMGI